MIAIFHITPYQNQTVMIAWGRFYELEAFICTF